VTAGPAAPGGQPSGPAHAAETPATGALGRGSRWLAAIPRHVGRARTSTVVLSLLFLAIGALYLNVRPTTAETTSPAGVVVTPVPVAPTSTRRATSTAPSTAPSTAATSTSSAPTGSTAPSSQPTTSAPAGTPSSAAPAPSTTAGLPTVASTSAAPTS
jgi:hypothetical protein